VSSGAPFRHFPDKTALTTAVAEQAMRRLRDARHLSENAGAWNEIDAVRTELFKAKQEMHDHIRTKYVELDVAQQKTDECAGW
jgi:AcrR family transcriptional regulator